MIFPAPSDIESSAFDPFSIKCNDIGVVRAGSPVLLFCHPALRGGTMMEKEKQLEKLTVKELREMALAMGGITGVTAMKKDELLAAIRQAKGLPEKEVREKPVDTVLEVKKRIRAFRRQREELREAGRRAEAGRLSRRISRLKKKTRRLARKAAAPKAS